MMWFKKSKKWLVVFESGHNNIGGCSLHILKSSVVISAPTEMEAYLLAQLNKPEHTNFHFGYKAEYQIIIDVKKI